MIGHVLPPMCGPASTATPAMPTARPRIRLAPSRSPPVSRSSTAAMIGAAAIRRPVIELVRWRSASDSSHHAAMISKNAKPANAFQWFRTMVTVLPRQGQRKQYRGADSDPGEHQHRNRHTLDGDLDQQVGDAPDDAHREEQDPSARAHAHTLRVRTDGRRRVYPGAARHVEIARFADIYSNFSCKTCDAYPA